MKIIKNVAIILLVIFCVYAGTWIGKIYQKKSENKLTSQLSLLYRQQTVEAVSALKKEIGVLYPRIDSLTKVAGIKSKQIERTTIIEHRLVYDTIPVSLSKDTANERLIHMSMNYKCFTAKGLIDFSKTNISLTNQDIGKMKVFLTDVQSKDTLTNVYYFNRESKRILFFTLKIGRKHFYSQTYSSCNGFTKTETINFIKR